MLWVSLKQVLIPFVTCQQSRAKFSVCERMLHNPMMPAHCVRKALFCKKNLFPVILGLSCFQKCIIMLLCTWEVKRSTQEARVPVGYTLSSSSKKLLPTLSESGIAISTKCLQCGILVHGSIINLPWPYMLLKYTVPLSITYTTLDT